MFRTDKPVNYRQRCVTDSKEPPCRSSIGTLTAPTVKLTQFQVGFTGIASNPAGVNFTSANTTPTFAVNEIGASLGTTGLKLPEGLYQIDYTAIITPAAGNTDLTATIAIDNLATGVVLQHISANIIYLPNNNAEIILSTSGTFKVSANDPEIGLFLSLTFLGGNTYTGIGNFVITKIA